MADYQLTQYEEPCAGLWVDFDLIANARL